MPHLFSPRRSLLLSLSLLTGPVAMALAESPITALVIDPQGHVITGSQWGLGIFRVEDRPERLQSASMPHLHDLAWSPSGHLLILAGGSPAEEGRVEALRWPGGTVSQRWEGHRDVVYRVAWLPDQHRLVTVSADGTCRIWSEASPQELLRYQGHSGPVTALAVLHDPEWVVTGGTEGTIHGWEPNTGVLRRTLSNHVGPILDLAVSPPTPGGSQRLASASEDRTVRFWLPSSGRLLRFARLPAVPHAIVWSADGKLVYAGCRDGVVRVIDPGTARVERDLKIAEGRILCLALPTGTSLVVGGEFGWRRVEIPVHQQR